MGDVQTEKDLGLQRRPGHRELFRPGPFPGFMKGFWETASSLSCTRGQRPPRRRGHPRDRGHPGRRDPPGCPQAKLSAHPPFFIHQRKEEDERTETYTFTCCPHSTSRTTRCMLMNRNFNLDRPEFAHAPYTMRDEEVSSEIPGFDGNLPPLSQPITKSASRIASLHKGNGPRNGPSIWPKCFISRVLTRWLWPTEERWRNLVWSSDSDSLRTE